MPADPRFARLRPLLESVSRSFYLSLRLLPAAVRPALSLAYLLARASDSIADVAAAPGDVRIRLLRGLPGEWPADGVDLLDADGDLPEADRSLLAAVPGLLEELCSSPDRVAIEGVWETIRRGQVFDIERFAGIPAPLGWDEVRDYTGLVAGCVGDFWTDLCLQHVPGYAALPPAELRQLGFSFGCGLQWVNILRDRHADAAAGRVYVGPGDLSRAFLLARGHLQDGARYASAVRPRRLRAACLLPLALAGRTLDLLEVSPDLENVKVSRWFVWRAFLGALLSTTSPK